MTKRVRPEWSHGRVRMVTRGQGERRAQPFAKDPKKVAAGQKGAMSRWHPEHGIAPVAAGTGDSSVAPGNVVQLPTRIEVLNPEAVPARMRPLALRGVAYARKLEALLEGQDVLFELAGDCVNAHTMYNVALLDAVKARNPGKRAKHTADARGWLKEHRTALATLSSLAGDLDLEPASDEVPPGFEVVEEEPKP